MSLAKFKIICACDDKYGIAKNDHIPWWGEQLRRADMHFFRQATLGKAVIMGRKTYEFLPAPLRGRHNVVISHSNGDNIIIVGALTSAPVVHVGSLDAALKWCYGAKLAAVVIGGESLYAQAVSHPQVEQIILSRVRGDYECDQFFPANLNLHLERSFPLAPQLNIEIYVPRVSQSEANLAECEYLNLLGRLLVAPERPSRAGPTRSLFMQTLRFELAREDRYTGKIRPTLPLLTSKFVPWKSVLYELLWFMRGCCSSNEKNENNKDDIDNKPSVEYLHKHGVKIWDHNTSREYLDGRNLRDYAQGETGPIYGAQWRNWNGTGIDQLAALVDGLRNDPYGRRHLLTAWNPEQLDKMCLPPCHYMAQFYIAGGQLSAAVHMRSADVALGVPFNIASYALLTHMLAHLTNLRAGELVLTMGDCHIYNEHVDGAMLQLLNSPMPAPFITFGANFLQCKSIDDFCALDSSDITIDDYKNYGKISYKLL